MTRPNAPQTFSAGEAAEMTDTPAWQLEFWCRTAGLLQPQQSGTGRGFHRSFDFNDIITIIILRELTRAGLTVPQLQRAFIEQRRKLALTPLHLRPVALFRDYIETVKTLARTFGKGDGYDEWLTAATNCLDRMKRRADLWTALHSTPPTATVDDSLREFLATIGQLPDSGLTVRERPDVRK
jgi:DNA-binding transcriptional MerR regulator